MAARTITIEVGNEYIKVCEVRSANGKEVMVYHAVTEDTPMGACEDGYIRNVTDIASVVRGIIAEEKIATKDATFVINSSKIASKEVILPNIKKEKIQELIEANASEYFPVNIEDYVLSFSVLEEVKEEGQNNVRVLVYAAPEEIVKSYYELARALKVNMRAIDYVGNATLQIMKLQITEEPTLIVQMGMDSTIVSVMDNKVLRLQRTVPYGKLLAINSIIEEKHVKFDVALELLHNSDIIKPTLDENETTGSLRFLINNVNRVIEYYRSKNPEAPILKTYIIGEGAQILGIDTLFASETTIETFVLDELQGIQAFNRVKMGLSLLKNYLPGIGTGIDPINFVPRDFIALEKQTTDTAIYRVLFIFAIFAAVMLTVIPYINYVSLSVQKTNRRDSIRKIQDIEDVLNNYYSTQDIFTDVAGFYATTIDSNEWTLDFFELLEEIAPKDISIETMNATNGTAGITGSATSKSSVAKLVNALQEEKAKEGANIIDVSVASVTETIDDEGVSTVVFGITVRYQPNIMEEIIDIYNQAQQGDAPEASESTKSE